MQTLSEGARGLNMLLKLNGDRVLFALSIGGALYAASLIVAASGF